MHIYNENIMQLRNIRTVQLCKQTCIATGDATQKPKLRSNQPVKFIIETLWKLKVKTVKHNLQ